MYYLELWHVACVIILLIACIARVLYAIFSGAVEFKEEIVFRPQIKKEVDHANDGAD